MWNLLGENWNYDEQNKKITITVTNENNGTAEYTTGEDEFTIVYRYSDYTEDEVVTMNQDFKVTVEEYSANNNVFTAKEWHNSQEINSQVNDLITYNIGTTADKLNIAKINANYNSEETVYESEFTTTVNVNILTSDLLEELKINSSKDTYVDANATEIDASVDVYYNKVKFKYGEIKNILQNGAIIEIQNLDGQVLHTLNNESVQNDANCEVVLGSKEKGVFVVFKNVSTNGNISVEFTKAIGKSSYDKTTLNNFKSVKSYVSSELKYKNYEEKYAMSEIWAIKEIEQSQTVAEISLSNNNLSTTAKNDGVEIRIALNNDKQNSDLYKNPGFELMFPKYVKNVVIQNINLMQKSGLNIANFQTYTENEIVKLRVELEGTQTKFCESTITDGTNILLNLNIELDEYTPRKQDQIKMYYYNECVTNYESQTKWTINKPAPEGILKQTNGFDVALVNFQAPNGMVTANAIINYDGQASKIKSVAQGERSVEIGVFQNSQIATMELVAMNNTENSCTDAIFMGRVPFAENKSVVTGQDLGTTVTATMLSGLVENVQNANMVTIYYSENGNATQDLADSQNGWTESVSDLKNIKSYMIVAKGEIAPGTVLRYTYDFEIPGNLDYDQAMYGSFGGFYNNSKITAYHETTEADKVGILSKKSIPLKLNLEVDASDKSDVKTNGYLKYTATVSNEGDVAYSDIKVNAGAPENTYICELSENVSSGNNGYVASSKNSKLWEIDILQPGETKTFSYVVKVKSGAASQNTLKNKVSMTIGSLNGQEIFSNEVENTVRESKLDIKVSSLSGNTLRLGSMLTYKIEVTNITEVDSGKFSVVMNVPEGLTYKSASSYTEEVDCEFDESTRVLTMNFDNLVAKSIITTNAVFAVENVNAKYITLQPEIRFADGTIMASTGTNFSIESAKIELSSGTNFDINQVAENQEVEIVYNLKSTGEIDAKNIDVTYEVSDYLENCTVNIECNSNGSIETFDGKLSEKSVTEHLMTLPKGSYVQYRITGKIKNVDKDLENVILSNINIEGANIVSKTETKEVYKIKDLGNNEGLENEQKQEGIYEVSGKVWLNSNNDGENQGIAGVQVQLLKNGEIADVTTTNNSGNYKFTELANGTYSVAYIYNQDIYTTGKLLDNQSREIVDFASYEVEAGKAVTDEIHVIDTNVNNVNLRLQEKDKFDFSINETISKAVVDIDGEEKVYEYSNLELAKVEIDPNKVDDAKLKFEYKISVENTGNVEGKITSIVDYLPAGMQFVESENDGWTNGLDGNIYNDTLRDEVIQPGEVKELTLVLAKDLQEDNTKVLSNKVKIAYTENDMRLTEAVEGNFATQETIVTVAEESHYGITIAITTISLSGLIAMFAYMVKTEKIDIKFKGKSLIKKFTNRR